MLGPRFSLPSTGLSVVHKKLQCSKAALKAMVLLDYSSYYTAQTVHNTDNLKLKINEKRLSIFKAKAFNKRSSEIPFFQNY